MKKKNIGPKDQKNPTEQRFIKLVWSISFVQKHSRHWLNAATICRLSTDSSRGLWLNTNIRGASFLGYISFRSQGFHLQVEQTDSSSHAAATETDKKIVPTEKKVSC